MCTTASILDEEQPKAASEFAARGSSEQASSLPPYFSRAEFDSRVAALRAIMARQDLSACLVSTPENIFYLTGLDHWGYFAPHLLIVLAQGEMVLATRSMERVTIENQVRNARFEGHSDSGTVAEPAVADLTISALPAAASASSRGQAVCHTGWRCVSGGVSRGRMDRRLRRGRWTAHAQESRRSGASCARRRVSPTQGPRARSRRSNLAQASVRSRRNARTR